MEVTTVRGHQNMASRYSPWYMGAMKNKPAVIIRAGLMLASTTPAGTLRLPNLHEVEDGLVIINSRVTDDGWTVVTRSTGTPDGCIFVPPTRLQSEDPERADAIAEALL